MTKVFLISAIVGSSESSSEQVGIILRHLASRGNDVTLLDISHGDCISHVPETYQDIQLDATVVEMLESADAVVLCTNEYCACLTQIFALTSSSNKKLSNKLKRSSNVWNHNGVCCTILGGSVKKSKVAKELWEVFQEPELDLTDIFPYGSPRLYNLDYTKETAQPTVV